MAPLALAFAALLLIPGSALARQDAEALRLRGIELGFNLDHAEAVATFREAIAADPNHLAGYRLLAAALWTRALLQSGAVTVGDFVGDSASFRARPAGAELQHAIAEVKRRADLLLAAQGGTRSASQTDAAFQAGAAYRLISSYAATIGGSQWQGLTAARRAYREHERILTRDPRRTDAGLTVGLYRYWVSRLPPMSRLVARISGLDADREGVRLVEAAAASEGIDQASALFSLIVIYNQQARYDEALTVIRDLQRRFPRNRLLWLEEGTTALRAGMPSVARTALEHGVQMLERDTRPRAPGELARWRHYYDIAHGHGGK